VAAKSEMGRFYCGAAMSVKKTRRMCPLRQSTRWAR
jgi:hypothetical protein